MERSKRRPAWVGVGTRQGHSYGGSQRPGSGKAASLQASEKHERRQLEREARKRQRRERQQEQRLANAEAAEAPREERSHKLGRTYNGCVVTHQEVLSSPTPASNTSRPLYCVSYGPIRQRPSTAPARENVGGRRTDKQSTEEAQRHSRNSGQQPLTRTYEADSWRCNRVACLSQETAVVLEACRTPLSSTSVAKRNRGRMTSKGKGLHVLSDDRCLADLDTLDVAGVCYTLCEAGLGQYTEGFARRGVTGKDLVECSDTDLAQVGVDFRPHRLRLLKMVEDSRLAATTREMARAAAGKDAVLHMSCLEGPLPLPSNGHSHHGGSGEFYALLSVGEEVIRCNPGVTNDTAQQLTADGTRIIHDGLKVEVWEGGVEDYLVAGGRVTGGILLRECCSWPWGTDVEGSVMVPLYGISEGQEGEDWGTALIALGVRWRDKADPEEDSAVCRAHELLQEVSQRVEGIKSTMSFGREQEMSANVRVSAEVKGQSHAKTRQADLREKRLQQEAAAVRLQSKTRQRQAKLEVAQRRVEKAEEEAVIFLQSKIRQMHAEHEVAQLKAAKEYAELERQARWRHSAVELKQRKAEQDATAIRLQSKTRQRQGKHKLDQLKVKREEERAANEKERQARRKQAAHDMKLKRAEQEAAAIRLQSKKRQKQNKVLVDSQLEEKEVIVLETTHQGSIMRPDEKGRCGEHKNEEEREQERAAVKLQALSRGKSARGCFSRKQRERETAAKEVQAESQGKASRAQQEHQWQKIETLEEEAEWARQEAAATGVQKAARKRAACKEVERLKALRRQHKLRSKAAAASISAPIAAGSAEEYAPEAFWQHEQQEANESGVAEAELLQELGMEKDAWKTAEEMHVEVATRLGAKEEEALDRAEAELTKLNEESEDLEATAALLQRRAAVQVQRVVRGRAARLAVKAKKGHRWQQEKEAAAVKMQAVTRGRAARNAAVREQQEKEAAAVKMQAVTRGWRARESFSRKKDAMTVMTERPIFSEIGDASNAFVSPEAAPRLSLAEQFQLSLTQAGAPMDFS
ncbi:unnamed protein product, partial [Chrysoparadoxa australica]